MRCNQVSDFKAKMHQIKFRLGLRADPAAELITLPRPSSYIYMAYS